MTRQGASSEPETFDSILFQLSSQKAFSDDTDSHAVGKQTPVGHSMQSAHTAAEQVDDVYSKSPTEQNVTADCRRRHMLPTDEIKPATPRSQSIEEWGSGDTVDSVERLQRRETTLSTQLVKPDEGSVAEHSAVEHGVSAESITSTFPGDQPLALADSIDDSKLIVKDETEQQISETRLLVSGDEITESIQDAKEEHAVLDRGDQMEDEYRDTEESMPEKSEEQPAESELTESVSAVEVSDKSFQTVFAHVDDERAAVETYQDEVKLTVGDPLLEEPPELDRILEAEFLKDEKTNHEPEQVAAAVAEEERKSVVLQQERTTTACIDGGKTATVQALSFAICSDELLPQTVEEQPACLPVLSDLTLTVQQQPSVQPEMTAAGIGTIEAGILGGDVSFVAQLSETGMQHEETMITSYDEIRHDICLPDTLDIAAQPVVETPVESEEVLGAESGAMWKDETDKTTERLDPDEKMPALAVEFSDSCTESSRTRRLEEDLPVRTQVGLAETKQMRLEAGYEHRFMDSVDKEDAETGTSAEWCVIEEGSPDAGFDVKLGDGVTARTYEEVPGDLGDVSSPYKETVYHSSIETTSSGYRTSTTSCTSNVLHDFDHFNLLI